MILYALRCAAGHEFEGWFRDGQTYDAQSAAGEIACPACGSNSVSKALMAPRLGRSSKSEPEPPAPAPMPASAPEPPPEPDAKAANIDPAQMRLLLRELRRHVEQNCDYVGDKFAEEARRIHYGEADPHAIYGESTPEEAEALADEGIEVGRIPWLPLNDA
ncbi:MAG TPA: DUF1178 family protein [Stellaceae bacterium]|jgi:hypothetical protein